MTHTSARCVTTLAFSINEVCARALLRAICTVNFSMSHYYLFIYWISFVVNESTQGQLLTCTGHQRGGGPVHGRAGVVYPERLFYAGTKITTDCRLFAF